MCSWILALGSFGRWRGNSHSVWELNCWNVHAYRPIDIAEEEGSKMKTSQGDIIFLLNKSIPISVTTLTNSDKVGTKHLISFQWKWISLHGFASWQMGPTVFENASCCTQSHKCIVVVSFLGWRTEWNLKLTTLGPAYISWEFSCDFVLCAV
jgi:hypothetical protein